VQSTFVIQFDLLYVFTVRKL